MLYKNPAISGTGKTWPPAVVFSVLWVATFALYLPAADAGWVTDTVDWQQKVQGMPFWDYLNLTQTRVPSLYQFTQLVTWLLYRVFGSSHLAWHLLNITLQSANATLAYIIFTRVAASVGLKNGKMIGAAAVVLFCLCPHISEVVVWKASFHYLLATLMLLLILRLLLAFLATPRLKYAIAAGLLFAASAFSLEVFYLTPWFVFTIILFYSRLPQVGREAIKQAWLGFFLPMLLMFIGHLFLLKSVTGFYASHLGSDMLQPLTSYLRKPPVYVFHVLFLGRFFPLALRDAVYGWCVRPLFLTFFYGTIAATLVAIGIRFRQWGGQGRVVALLFLWVLLSWVIVCPVWVAGNQVVSYDRYAYLMLPFVYLLVCTLAAGLAPRKAALALIAVYALANLRFTLRENNYWHQTNKVMAQLISTFPAIPGDKTVLLLNLPDNMDGVPMISAMPAGSFKQFYNVNSPVKTTCTIYDVASHNVNDASDGAQATALNDSMVRVTLNQWGTWWWYNFKGAGSYENESYKMNLTDPGHMYELTLKNNPASYVLLYCTGGTWHTVDMHLKNNSSN